MVSYLSVPIHTQKEHLSFLPFHSKTIRDGSTFPYFFGVVLNRENVKIE